MQLSSSKILLMVVQAMLLLACVAYIYFIYYANISPDKHARNAYEQTQCTIEQARIQTAKKIVALFRIDFFVTYVAQGVRYQNVETSGNGLDRSFTTDEKSQAQLLQQFTVGSIHPCWYNPANPKMVILVHRHNGSATFRLFIPAMIGIIMLYYLIRRIFYFLK